MKGKVVVVCQIYIILFLRTLGQYQARRGKSLNNNEISLCFARFHGLTHNARGGDFFINNFFNIKFKGILLKLKIVCHTISVE
jgi:hypothetical protein